MNSNVKGYTNNVVKETTKSFLKRLASEVDIPVPGTNSSVGISAVKFGIYRLWIIIIICKTRMRDCLYAYGSHNYHLQQ